MKTMIVETTGDNDKLLLNIDKITLILKRKVDPEDVYQVRMEGLQETLPLIIKQNDIPDELKNDFQLLK